MLWMAAELGSALYARLRECVLSVSGNEGKKECETRCEVSEEDYLLTGSFPEWYICNY